MKTKLANPGPLGLLGFGMTTVLLNLHNVGLLPLSIAIVAMGLALGGLAQIITGIEPASKIALGYYLLLWGIFTLFMFIGTLKHNKATQVVFGSLTILFICPNNVDF